tara:strand:+ start:302 stop:1153 length:852 start_codon:yes stop_codon:yes gene_type:complete
MATKIIKSLVKSLETAKDAIGNGSSWIYSTGDFFVRVINGGDNVYARKTNTFSMRKVNLAPLGLTKKDADWVSIGHKQLFNYVGKTSLNVPKAVQNKIGGLWNLIECVILSTSKSITSDQNSFSASMTKALMDQYGLTYDTIDCKEVNEVYKTFFKLTKKDGNPSAQMTDKKLKSMIKAALKTRGQASKSKGKNSKGHPSKTSFAGVMERINTTAEYCTDLQASKDARENQTKAISAMVKDGTLDKETLVLRIANLDLLKKEYMTQLNAIREQEEKEQAKKVA